MNREDMLKQLGISHDQLQDLFQKFEAFLASLNPQQQQIVKFSLPTVKEAVEAFGGDATESDLMNLFQADPQRAPLACFLPLQQGKAR